MPEIPAGFVLDEVRVTLRPDLRFTPIYAGPAAAKGRHTNMSVPMILKQNDGATTAGATAPATSGNDDAATAATADSSPVADAPMLFAKVSYNIDTDAGADAALAQPAAAAATANYQLTSATADSSPDEEPPAHPPFDPARVEWFFLTADAAPAKGQAHGAYAGPNAAALSAVAGETDSKRLKTPSRHMSMDWCHVSVHADIPAGRPFMESTNPYLSQEVHEREEIGQEV